MTRREDIEMDAELESKIRGSIGSISEQSFFAMRDAVCIGQSEKNITQYIQSRVMLDIAGLLRENDKETIPEIETLIAGLVEEKICCQITAEIRYNSSEGVRVAVVIGPAL